MKQMEVTATQLKSNFGHYLEQSRFEDIWIRKNGKTVAKLVSTNVSSVDAISGILKGTEPAKTDRHSIREERLSEYEVHD